MHCSLVILRSPPLPWYGFLAVFGKVPQLKLDPTAVTYHL